MPRILSAGLCVLLFSPLSHVFAQVNEELAITQQLARATAPQLVLDRVERYQARSPGRAAWLQWEVLRCEALSTLGRHRELTERLAGVPAESPAPTACLIAGTRAALALREPELAQSYAAHVLWRAKPSASEAQAARLAVIDANLAARRGEAAFRAMLRYQQDYRPLERERVASWVEGLLALGMEREALNWLQQLDDASPVKLALRARSGLLAPDAAAAQARAALAKGGDVRYWHVISQIGRQQAKPALQIEALEHLLNATATATAPNTGALWQAYIATAREVGNAQRLLIGDDTAWADYAGRRLGSEPQVARAVFAYLMDHAKDRQTRHTAQLQLVHALHESALDRVALLLFNEKFSDTGTLDAPTRYLLGNAAEAQGDAALALRLLEKLPAPPGVEQDEWTLRSARLARRSGAGDADIEALAKAYAGRKSLSRPLVHGLTEFGEELLDGGRTEAAKSVFDTALRYADGDQARAILFGLARVQEMRGERGSAAQFYLRAASIDNAVDALAVEARLRAALDLARAGYAHDARRQFQWLLANSKQPAHVDIARRHLKNLPVR